MNDTRDKTRQPLPRRAQASTPLIDESIRQDIFRDTPKLPPLPKTDQPHLLVVDDDQSFLDRMRQGWERHYRDAFVLYTLHPDQEDLCRWILKHKQQNARLDAVYLDRHLGDSIGVSALEYLCRLRAEPHTRYLPVVVMTTHDFEEDDETKRRELLRYAQWLLYRKNYYNEFLYQMVTFLPSVQEAAQDRMWSDLISETAKGIAESHVLARDGTESRLLGNLDAFFNQYMGLCLYFLHRADKTGDLVVCCPGEPSKYLGFPERLWEDSLPLLKELGETPVKHDALDAAQLGIWKQLSGKRFLGVALYYEGRRLGTLTLYRERSQPAFRDKDRDYLGHLALQVGNFLGWRQRWQQQQRRQKCLADFAKLATDSVAESPLLDQLAKILHREIHADDNARTKITLRLLDRASGQIQRRIHFGLDAKAAVITLDTQRSLYARALRDHENIRCDDVRQMKDQFVPTTPGICSCLTVPLLAGNQVFGGVNLECLSEGYYDEDDERFARTLCDFAAAALMRLRQFAFHRSLIELLHAFWYGEAFDNSRLRIYQALQHLTGYALLMYLSPGQGGWQLEQVVDSIDDQTRLLPEKVAAVWRQRIRERWHDTFICQVITGQPPRFGYVEGAAAIKFQIETDLRASGEKLIARAQAVIPIECDGKLRAAIVLLFRLDQALNAEQRALLELFGRVTGDMLYHLEEKRRLQERLEDVETEAQLGFLYGQMRHVLTNQLGGINNQLELLEEDGAEVRRLQQIRRTLSTLDAHLKSMRYMVQTPEKKPVALEPLWAELQEEFGPTTAQSARLETGALPMQVCLTDRNSLRAILYNLVLNASQAAQQAGLTCTVRLDGAVQDNQLCLRLSDDGPGIAPEQGERLFQRGFTTRAEGTGFGLHFCRYLAQRLGGTLEWDAAYRKGARFILTLPQQEQTP